MKNKLTRRGRSRDTEVRAMSNKQPEEPARQADVLFVIAWIFIAIMLYGLM